MKNIQKKNNGQKYIIKAVQSILHIQEIKQVKHRWQTCDYKLGYRQDQRLSRNTTGPVTNYIKYNICGKEIYKYIYNMLQCTLIVYFVKNNRNFLYYTIISTSLLQNGSSKTSISLSVEDRFISRDHVIVVA